MNKTSVAQQPKTTSFFPPVQGLLQRKCACGNHTAAGGECAACAKNKAGLQRKLAIGASNDPLELEADRVADQVMATPANSTVNSAPLRIQRYSGQASEGVGTAPASVDRVLASLGRPLEPILQQDMEQRFGHDFSQVRVHTGGAAEQSARDVNANAYTVENNVVFGEGRFVSGTQEGRRLLAHELTHVVQQNEFATVSQTKFTGSKPGYASEHKNVRIGNTRVRHHVGSALHRQPTPTAPAGAQSWAGCAANRIGQLNSELAEATAWVNQAISDLQTTERPDRTNGALGRYLSTDPAHISGTIIPRLQAILADLNLGASNFRCQTEQQCLAVFPAGADAYSGHPITLCPGYFNADSLGRPTDLIHEAGHNAGLAGNVIEWQWPFPGLNVPTRLGNTESYAAFVRSNRYPQLPPFQQTGGVQLGVGALFPGGGISPRFLVKAELDALLSQRIVRFFDLRLGLRVDVDTSGTVLGSATLGTRVFAPVSVSQTPLFLDLRTGFVVGRAADVGPRFEQINPFIDINVLGPSGEGRIGILRGNFGGSIGYRHIWNIVKSNPNLQEVTINGEIRF